MGQEVSSKEIDVSWDDLERIFVAEKRFPLVNPLPVPLLLLLRIHLWFHFEFVFNGVHLGKEEEGW